jgi:hypothetical protein
VKTSVRRDMPRLKRCSEPGCVRLEDIEGLCWWCRQSRDALKKRLETQNA